MKEVIIFGKAISGSTLTFREVNKIAKEKGYFIHPDCCNERVVEFLKLQPYNYNSTFYTTWKDVEEKTREELWFDQVHHYLSTYGTDFTGEVSIQNELAKSVFKDLKVISPMNLDELTIKILALLESGIALKEETVVDLVELCEEFNIILDIDKVKNKEAKMFLHRKLDTLPFETEEFIRYLIFLITGTTLLIKSSSLIELIKSATISVNLTALIERFGKKNLAKSWNRFDVILLAMKRKDSSLILNQVQRLSKKYHEKYIHGYFEKLLSEECDLSLLEDYLSTLSNFRKITLLEAILVRKSGSSIQLTRIRNGKTWVENREATYFEYFEVVYKMIYKSLVDSLSKKACKIKLHESVNFALPTSEKNFLGHIPSKSSIEIGKNSVIGVHWDGDSGADDIDLSYLDLKGEKIGWNSKYFNEGITYSGDMTSPVTVKPGVTEACEMLKFNDTPLDGIVSANLYRGGKGAKFKLFVGSATKNIQETRLMIDQDDIIISVDLEFKFKQLGLFLVTEGVGRFVYLGLSEQAVSDGKGTVTQQTIQYAINTKDSYLNLKEVLTDAGFTLVMSSPDIDLNQADKSLLISLLS